MQGVGVRVGVGIGVGVNVAVAVGVGVNVAVAVDVGVGLAVAVAVGVGLAVGVGVGVPPPIGPWIATIIGEPVLKKPTMALILRKRFRVPSDRACVLSNSPRRTAVALIIERAVISPARLLKRRMKSDVRDIHSWCEGHAERLDRAIEVLVIERVFVVVNTSRRVGHFVAHEPQPIVTGIGLELSNRCACPRVNGRLHSRRRTNSGKRKAVAAAIHSELAIRGIVIHVTLPWM